MNRKLNPLTFLVLLVIGLGSGLALSIVYASLTFNATSITSDGILSLTGAGSSTIDVGVGTLSIQTTNNGPITTGNGLFTIGGALNASGTITQNGTPVNISTTTASIGVSFDGGGAVIASNASSSPFQIPYAGTVRRWWMTSDLSCTASFDVWKANKAIPTNANRIAGTDVPTLTSQQISSSSALTGWTTSLSAGDVLMIVATSTPSVCQKATIGIDYSKL